MRDVRYGSLADIGQPIRDVRFAPESRHVQRRNRCLLCAKRRHRCGFENCACKRWLTVCKIPLADLTERVTVEREHFRSCLRPPCRSHPHSAGRAALISTKSHCSARRCWLPPSSESRFLWRGSPPGGRDSVISQRHSETRCETRKCVSQISLSLYTIGYGEHPPRKGRARGCASTELNGGGGPRPGAHHKKEP